MENLILNNRFRLLGFCLVCIPLFLLSCSEEEIPTSRASIQKSRSMLDLRDYKSDTVDFFVTDEDIARYCQYVERLHDQPSYGKAIEVDALYFDDEITGYVINFENGWQIVSSDKRGPVVLAKSRRGSFHAENANENIKTWLDILFEDIAYRKNNESDYYLYLDKEGLQGEAFSVALWGAITNGHFTGDLKKREGLNREETKIPPLEPPGDYIYSYTYTTTEYDTLSHLMSTHWHQHNPYNSFIPLVSFSGTDRCPAGCVTIAGAQVLYYLHYFLGKPGYSPSFGYCVGSYQGYSSSFTGASPDTWDFMETSLDSCDYRGLLIGHVALLTDVEFEPGGSSADTKDLHDITFPYYGLSSNYSTTYNRDTVYNNLKDGLPVIFAAKRRKNIFSNVGHSWVIDGYVDEITFYHDVYEWQYVTEPTVPVPNYPPYEIITNQSPQLKFFRMNWGWGNSYPYYEDDGVYSTSGSWVNPQHQNYNPYSHGKKIISRFR